MCFGILNSTFAINKRVWQAIFSRTRHLYLGGKVTLWSHVSPMNVLGNVSSSVHEVGSRTNTSSDTITPKPFPLCLLKLSRSLPVIQRIIQFILIRSWYQIHINLSKSFSLCKVFVFLLICGLFPGVLGCSVNSWTWKVLIFGRKIECGKLIAKSVTWIGCLFSKENLFEFFALSLWGFVRWHKI